MRQLFAWKRVTTGINVSCGGRVSGVNHLPTGSTDTRLPPPDVWFFIERPRALSKHSCSAVPSLWCNPYTPSWQDLLFVGFLPKSAMTAASAVERQFTFWLARPRPIAIHDGPQQACFATCAAFLRRSPQNQLNINNKFLRETIFGLPLSSNCFGQRLKMITDDYGHSSKLCGCSSGGG